MTTLRVYKKHPLAVRIWHWLNVPILAIMVWSGFLIYWANPEYGIPREWLNALGMNQQLGVGLAWHWVFAVLFTFNFILYLGAQVVSRHWRFLWPRLKDLKDAPVVAAHDLHLVKSAPVVTGKYNAAQKLTYFLVGVCALLMILTGFAIYKPTQLSFLVWIFGGYVWTRKIHFYLTCFLMLFFVVHVLQVVRAGWNNYRAMVTGLEKVENETPRT